MEGKSGVEKAPLITKENTYCYSRRSDHNIKSWAQQRMGGMNEKLVDVENGAGKETFSGKKKVKN
ncbi:CIC11C00000000755 [Sungouiella intermedia]|uniref:CIC11C00000000755 n=1 Tax=Sungouiella intermedia TaxID=45354 RepID=A0A1L0B930_9ASCO|nr:CIC11C00000000755 [[Candida] intermedia]